MGGSVSAVLPVLATIALAVATDGASLAEEGLAAGAAEGAGEAAAGEAAASAATDVAVEDATATSVGDLATQDAIAADNIDVGGGFNPATGAGDAVTADAAAETGVTSSAADLAAPESAASTLDTLRAVGTGAQLGSLAATLLTPQPQPTADSTNALTGTQTQGATMAMSPGGAGASGGSSGTIPGVAGTLLTTKDQMGGSSGGTLLGS